MPELSVRFEGNTYISRGGVWFTAGGQQVNASADFIPRLDALLAEAQAKVEAENPAVPEAPYDELADPSEGEPVAP